MQNYHKILNANLLFPSYKNSLRRFRPFDMLYIGHLGVNAS